MGDAELCRQMSSVESPGIPRGRDVFDSIDIAPPTWAWPTVILQAATGPSGSPAEALTVRDARRIVTDQNADDEIRDAIWSQLVRHARNDPPKWEQVTIWVVLPTLRRIAYRLHRSWGVDMHDIQSDVVLGFLDALRQTDPDQQRIGARLWWRTFGFARRECERATRERPSEYIELHLERRAQLHAATDEPGLEPMQECVASNDPSNVEGIRLAALADRLGLSRTVASGLIDSRGNGPGHAA